MDRVVRGVTGAIGAALLAAALAGGWAEALSAGEATAWPRADLAGPAEPPTRLAPADNPNAEAMAEMPIAETPHSFGETDNAESSSPTVGSMASPLLTSEPDQDRSLQLEQVAEQADRRTRHGFELAGRGAHFAARAEFLGALGLVAEGLDTQQKTDAHAHALAAALTALKEAEDFLPRESKLEADVDLPGIVAVHTTPVLKDHAGQATPLTALRSYWTFAQEKFAAAAGREVAGSMALHALGKLHGAWAQKKAAPILAPESKAVVFYQAALLVQPRNFLAANDLGVLLAQCGRYDDARAMLEHSISVCPQATGWRNLAVVYRQLGQPSLAEHATTQAARLGQRELARRQTSPTATSDCVRWVDQQAFAQTATNTPNAAVATARPPVAKPPAAGMTPAAAPTRMPIAAWPSTAPPGQDANDLAPTPAAAQRRAWAVPAYQR
jgi:tetratricopeptide (TPR) repeat protein